MPRVSIIVPIYNVEKYIERCVRSLFAQTLDNIEFVFIDDCTPDRSTELLETEIDKNRHRIAEMNWTVKTVRMPTNSGQAAVRRHGILLATGDYIIHCDSDDWIEPDMYRVMYEKAIEENADMVVCDYEMTDGTNAIRVYSFVEDYDNLVANFILRKNKCCVWNKLIKRDLYQQSDIVFPQFNMGEDLCIVLQVITKCNRVSYISVPYYKYYQNVYSISNEPSFESVISRWEQTICNIKLVEEFYRNHDIYDCYNKEFEALKYYGKQSIRPALCTKGMYKKWKESFPEINDSVYFNDYISVRDRIECLLINLHIYNFLRKLKLCLK